MEILAVVLDREALGHCHQRLLKSFALVALSETSFERDGANFDSIRFLCPQRHDAWKQYSSKNRHPHDCCYLGEKLYRHLV